MSDMTMDLCITTDFAADRGLAFPYLRQIADAGFSHVHWCHEWNTDYVYLPAEITEIRQWLSHLGLQLLDMHGSAGKKRCWYSRREDQRLAGVELVANRLEMTAALGGAVLVMHTPPLLPRKSASQAEHSQLHRSLDTLAPLATKLGVRIAIENMMDDDFAGIDKLLADCSSDFLGLCYDSGHGNIGGPGLEHLDRHKHRLLSLHLHDNDGKGDKHWLPLTGTVDWPRLCGIIARSAYTDCVSMESNIHKSPVRDSTEFLRRAFDAGRALTDMIAREKQNPAIKVAGL